MEKRSILPVVLGVATAFLVLVAVVILNMDAIMMRFAPKMYLSSLLAKTVKELQLETKNEVYPKYHDIKDGADMSVSGTIFDKAVDIKVQYDAPGRFLYADGAFESINFHGYIEDEETGVCLDDLMDVYFTVPTKSFGEVYNQSLVSGVMPFKVNNKLDLSLDFLQKEQGADLNKLYLSASDMLDGVKLENGSEEGEILAMLDGVKFKNGMKEILNSLKGENEKTLSLVNRIFGVDVGGVFIDSMIAEFDKIQTDEAVTVSIVERNSYIVKLHTKLNLSEGGGFDILIDSSKNSKLLDNVLISFDYETPSARIGIKYSCDGNRFNEISELYKNESIELIFGNATLLELRRNETGTLFERNGTISAISGQNEITEIKYTSAVSEEIDTINVSQILMNSENKGSINLEIKNPTEISLPQKSRYPLLQLDMEDLANLGKALIFND